MQEAAITNLECVKKLVLRFLFALVFSWGCESLYICILQRYYVHAYKPTIGLTPKNGIQSQPREEKLTSVVDSSGPNGRK